LRAEEIVGAVAEEMLYGTSSGIAESKFPKAMTFGFLFESSEGGSAHDGNAAKSKWVGARRIRGNATSGH